MSAGLFDLDDPTTDMLRTALLSQDGLYRYTLNRIWGAADNLVAWIMLNPSTADHAVDDPTIRRCVGFARQWGYGGIVVVNLFAWRATKPEELTRTTDPVGRANEQHIFNVTTGRDVICAWGASVPHYWRHRPTGLVAQLRQRDARLHHIGLTKDGHPRHPLFVRGDTKPTRWTP